MKITFQLANTKQLKGFVNSRKGEEKFGDKIETLDKNESIPKGLANSKADFVLLGIPEDIGVFANHGNPGAKNTWELTLKTLLNIQVNAFTKPEDILILGHVSVPDNCYTAINDTTLSKAGKIKKARSIVSEIDKTVSYYMSLIAKAGKKAIVIGGGHNNSYGNLKGMALGLNSPMNVVNFDAHTDLRNLEGRHSGNGFSYAFNEGFINKYFGFGFHENYLGPAALELIKANPNNFDYNTYEEIAVRKTKSFKKELQKAKKYIDNGPYGIEIDCDAIENFPSSAVTPSGFSTAQARQFIAFMAADSNAKYIHICEAAPTKKRHHTVAKLISYFITDFIKSK